ncbi:E3 ubiquitin-protein ligase RFWD3 [Melia azedarach]|uniref:E3 ubiquitin-protein ligase RFWD3 n=1 Tax=Melia azedarach TaxID=155640 RepID=A0ACC1X137_MELAZ|nr:E3 ubiquitin-protein ligase RFWD3 [Melia azedarach]
MMANRNSPQFNRHRLEDGELETAAEQFLHLDEEEETETEEEEDDETANDYEDETEEEEEEEEEELITVAESPPRVSSSVQLRVGDGEKRRRDEKGGEACSLSGIESGDCSQGSDWDRSDIEGLFCPICMDAWTNNGSHHICCLPCGHIYGLSCIKRWLQQGQSSGKCPQCNQKCSLKDVRKLFASRIVAIDEESQKRIHSLEAKCASLEKKIAGWGKQEAKWQKREAELHLKVHQLQERAHFLEHLLGDSQNGLSGYSAASATGSCQEQSAFGPNSASNFHGKASSNIFVLHKALWVDGARLFDVDESSQILLMARRLPGIGGNGTHLLTKVGLIHPHETEDILLPSCTKAVKDLHFSYFNHSLALFASLGKKLSVLSMESNNVILNYDLPAAAWSCAWDFNNAHNIYAGLQNGSLLVFDMRQTVRPLESLNGPSCNPIHTIHSLARPGVTTLLSASSVGVCEWNFVGGEERSHLVPETENQGVCISLAYCSSSDDIVASFRPKVEFSNEIAFSQTVLTPPMIGQGIQGSRVLLKKVGNCYQKLGSSSTIVNDIRLPKSTIIHLENQKRLFASGEEVTHELILQELPSFSVVQRLKSQNHPIRDVKYIRAHNPGLLCCLSEDALQLYSTLLT